MYVFCLFVLLNDIYSRAQACEVRVEESMILRDFWVLRFFGSQNFFHVVNEKDNSFNCTV